MNYKKVDSTKLKNIIFFSMFFTFSEYFLIQLKYFFSGTKCVLDFVYNLSRSNVSKSDGSLASSYTLKGFSQLVYIYIHTLSPLSLSHTHISLSLSQHKVVTCVSFCYAAWSVGAECWLCWIQSLWTAVTATIFSHIPSRPHLFFSIFL